MENKTVEMVVKDLLLADNRKKRRPQVSQAGSATNQLLGIVGTGNVTRWTRCPSCHSTNNVKALNTNNNNNNILLSK